MLTETQNILNRLAAADREHQKEAGGRLLLRGVKYVCAAVLVAFIVDVIFHLNAGWRLGLLLALISGVLVLAIFSWRLAFVRRNRMEHIARFLEMRDPALGSRLINLLQLDEQTRDRSLASPTRDLARQAVENYAAELGNVRIENLARTDEVRLHLKRAAWALLGFTVLLAVGFRITAVEMARFADPFGDHPPYSFTHLEIVQPGPAGTNVLYGKGLIVKVKALGHQPKEIFLTSFPPGHPDQAATLPMFDEGGVGFNQLLDNVRTDLVVFAHTKDHVSESRQARIGVLLTPQLEKAFVRIAPPDYTGLKPEEKRYEFKGVQALEGSEVKFRLQSNRPLREGLLEITAGDQPPQRLVLKKSADNEVSGSFIATDSGRLRFGIVDVAGLPSQGDCEAALTVTHDLPPEIRITNPERDAVAAMDFKLQAQIESSDDYGLREIRLHRGLNGVYSAPKVFKYDTIVLDSRETADFNFADLGVQPGDVISLFAEAVDNAPQPHLARSQIVRLQVISVEDYNNYLREQSDISDTEAKYAELNDDLQELIEKQKELGDAAQKLNDQLAKAGAKQRDALAQQLDSLIAQQNELNAKLNQQAERMENFVRQNPLYDVEQDLRKLLRQQAENIRQSTQTNDAAARDVAQRSSPPGASRQLSPDMLNDFKKASDDQIARLGQVHEDADQQMVQKLDDMSQMQELIKDFNLFGSLYRTQQDLAQQTQAYNRPGQLNREDQLAMKDLAATEKQVADTLDQLQAKLRDDAKAAGKLFPKAAQSGRDLADQITENRMEPLAEQATSQMLAADGEQSFQLADRLRAEMEKLFGECQGGNCPSSNELDTYLKLQRMNPGSNFAQMSRSRKFGFGTGRGQAGGMGEGMMGTAGYAVMDGSSMDVLGNESSVRNGNAAARQSSRFGRGAGALAAGGRGVAGKPDVIKGLNPVNRQSAAASSETVIQEYNDVVENYFKTITTKKEEPVNEKSK
jgi:ElaB/YqjD/DUF883 family membrane-anchored ribosome-binding protein